MRMRMRIRMGMGTGMRMQEAWPIKFQTDMLNGNNVPQVSSKMSKRDGISTKKKLEPNIGRRMPLSFLFFSTAD